MIDDEFNEAQRLNYIYKTEGFYGIIDYAKDKLQDYGGVSEVEDGLWVMITGGWSDNEFWMNCLNNPISIFHMKHYCAYTRGGAFYYTEKPHDEIEIRLKREKKNVKPKAETDCLSEGTISQFQKDLKEGNFIEFTAH